MKSSCHIFESGFEFEFARTLKGVFFIEFQIHGTNTVRSGKGCGYERLRGIFDSEVDFSIIPDADKSAASLSLNLLRHALALESGDVEAAANTRSSIATALGEDHALLSIIDLRTRLSFGTPDSMEIARKYIENEENIISRTRAILFALESSNPEIPQWLKNQHSMLSTESLRKDIPSHRRLIAQYWYWRGVLEPNMRLSHWREAINRFKSAECSKASNDLLIKLSRSL